jgi:hypothetical protein
VKVTWHGNNTAAINTLLDGFMARAEPDGPRLHLVGMGLNTFVSVGDTIETEGDRLGIHRKKPLEQPDRYVTWEGNNILEIDEFLKLQGVWIEVSSERLNIHAQDKTIASLGRGDRITKKADGNIVVSRAGQHHRV